MVKAVVGEDGKIVEALEKGDLIAASEKVQRVILRYLLFTAVPSLLAFAWIVSAYASDNRAYHTAQERRLAADSLMIVENKASIAENRQMLRQIDSLRFEVRRLADEMQTTNKILRSR